MPLYEHTVRGGEHLGLIAGRYGVRHQELVALNPQLRDPNLIRAGDTIRVCPEIFPHVTRRVEHEVQAGETLGVIAHTYGLTVVELLAQQPVGAISDPNLVRVGQRLVLRIDGGLAPDFLPPETRRSRRRGGKRAPVTVSLPASEHLLIKRPKLAFGTDKTIGLVQRAIARYKRRHRGAPRIVVGDLSRKGGGALRPHISHRTGRDIDLGYVLRGAARSRFGGVTPQTLDVPRTWDLLQAFLETRQVVYIFVDYRIQKQLYEYAQSQRVPQKTLDELFQYPHGRGRARGIIRHWPSHKHHFHVRFRS